MNILSIFNIHDTPTYMLYGDEQIHYLYHNVQMLTLISNKQVHKKIHYHVICS